MVDLLEGSSNFGSEVKWWIGVVAPRSAWADGGNYDNDKDYGNKQNKGEVEGIYYNRVKVRVLDIMTRLLTHMTYLGLTSWHHP